MMKYRSFLFGCCLSGLLMLTGCVAVQPYDYTEFKAANPRSLLVLPPLNESPDIKATAGVWAQSTRPLAEAGYYVLPVTLVDEMLQQNGVHTAADAQSIPYTKLAEVFDADAAVYLKVKNYGTTFQIFNSETRVSVEGKIVSLRNGHELWSGTATASSSEQSQQNQGGLLGALVGAVINQVIASNTDAAYPMAGTAQERLLGLRPHAQDGVIPGPRSPLYDQTTPSAK